MIKVFNRLHTLKSSENCDKFSKSVSYETLVGGTTTTGRGYKQTRRLFLSSANKPLSAVGTLTSLLCNSAKVVEKLLQISHALRSDNESEKSGKTEVYAGYRFCKTMRFLYKNLVDYLLQMLHDFRLVKVPGLIVVDTLTLLLCNSAKVKTLSLLSRCCAGKKQRESSLILRKAKFQAIFKFVLSSASGGAGGGKYNRISAFVLMPVLLIRRSLEKFFKKNFRDDPSCFGFAKVLALALILTLITTAESQADTNDINCKTGQQSCGTNCCWSVEGETLKVTGGADGSIGKIDSYILNSEDYFDADGNARPWADSAGVIKNIKIEGISEIGRGAFFKMNAENVEFDNSLESIDTQAFSYNNFQKLKLPDSLKSIANQVFQLNKLTSIVIPDECAVTYRSFDDINTLQEVILPYNIKGKYSSVTWGDVASMREDLKIVCMGSKEDCAKVQNSLKSYIGSLGTYDTFDISSRFRLANYMQCNSTNYYWNGAECLREPDVTKRKCCSSCKDMGGWCNRIRYTPAEAAEVLKDDNNEITITFKK